MGWKISNFARNKLIILIVIWLLLIYYFYYVHFDKFKLILLSIMFIITIFVILKNPKKWEKDYKTNKAKKLRKKIYGHFLIKYLLVIIGTGVLAYIFIIQGDRNFLWFVGSLIVYYVFLYFLFKLLKI